MPGQPQVGLHLVGAPAPMPMAAAAAPAGSGLSSQLTVLAAFAKELELQSHLVHLNFTGEMFLSLHQYLKGRYETHLEQFDTLAEFVRIQGDCLPVSTGAFKQVLPALDSDGTVEAYVGNLRTFTAMAKQLEASAAEDRAIDVANYAADLVADAGKAVWFLTAAMGC